MYRLCCLILVLLVGGCVTTPYQQPWTWSPRHDNDANLRAMVANPQDLVAGTGARNSAGAEAAPPVARLLSGRRYPLPNVSATGIYPETETQPQGNANPGSGQ